MTASRKNIMLGTAGHVDHGKTALVKLLTGCDTDTLAAEKQRGLTIELGFAPCRMRDERITGIVDVPGHVDFIRNMVAGAHGVDVVILVVAADDGVMPQTREHLDILTLMGVRRGVVALTKIDLVDEELRGLVTEDVRGFLAGTFLEGAAVCPISNITGEGFDGFFTALNEAVAACEQRETTGRFRLWIERVFGIRGFGTVLSGIPTAGEVHVGDRLRLVPGGQVGRVRKMEVYGQEADAGRAGECVALNLTDIDPSDLGRGKVLCEGDAFEAVTMAEGELRILDHVPSPLKDYAEVHLHVGTADVMAHVALLDGRRRLGPGEGGMVQLRLAEPLGVAAGDRFVIRCGIAGQAGGKMTTIGGGRILGASNVRLRRNRPWTLAMLSARREAIDSPAQWCALALKEAGCLLSADALAKRAQMSAGHVGSLLKDLCDDGAVREAGGRFVHRETLAEAAERIVAALSAFHAANPMRLGMDQAELLSGLKADRGACELAVADLIGQGALRREGSVVGLAGRTAEVPPAEQRLCEQVEARLAEAGLAPPRPPELAAALRAGEDRLARAIRLLADRGAVVVLDEKVVMHHDAVAAARKVALELFERSGGFTTMEFRDALGVSRKYAVPLLDYFDTVRLTVRSGNRRTPGAEAKRLL